MNYIELSIKDVKEKTSELYKKIAKDFNYDLVIFIARGSFIIGEELSKLNNVPLLEIYATRKGGKLKKIIKPLFKFIPRSILIKLRSKEIKSSFHEKNDDRNVQYNNDVFLKYKECKKILLVDDSIDSGYSVKYTLDILKSMFKKAEFKVAVFNVMNYSCIKSDYCLYEDHMICGPWSNDSKENNLYLKMYYEWKKEYEKE